MTPEKFESIKKEVRSVMSGLLDTCIEDSTSEFVSDSIWDNLPNEVADDETKKCFDKDDEGGIDTDILDKMVEEMTNNFMERFK